MGRTSKGGLLTGADTAATNPLDKGPTLGGIVVVPLMNTCAGFDRGANPIEDLGIATIPFTYYVCAVACNQSGTGTAGDVYAVDSGSNLVCQRMDVSVAGMVLHTNRGTVPSGASPQPVGAVMISRVPGAAGGQTSDELNRYLPRQPSGGHGLFQNWLNAGAGPYPAAFAMTSHTFIALNGFAIDHDQPGASGSDVPYLAALD